MSDPVTQAEIEDVLSSIRRLVSEDSSALSRRVPVRDRVEQNATSADQAPLQGEPLSEHAKPTSRLVLTPALRVPDVAQETSEGSKATHFPSGEGDMISGGTADAVGSAVSHITDNAPIAEAHMELNAEPMNDPAEVLTLYSGEAGEGVSVEPEVSDSGLGCDEPDPVAAEPVETQEQNQDLDPSAPWRNPDATLFGAVDGASEAPATTSDVLDEPTSWAHEGNSVSDAIDPYADVDPALTGGLGVSAVVQKIAELEAKVARSDGQWEPDGESSDPYSGTNIETLEWQDHIEEEADPAPDFDEDTTDPENAAPDVDTGFDAAALAEEAVTSEAMDALDSGAAEESYLDEESLRELVADIVRSELQGALGERITRNVRKLVRREIHRALAAQDLT